MLSGISGPSWLLLMRINGIHRFLDCAHSVDFTQLHGDCIKEIFWHKYQTCIISASAHIPLMNQDEMYGAHHWLLVI